ncbi:MAG: hypothetical protein LBS07_01035 [Prevotellaceae bacterium]|jgi:hypothetical protein|nr:hypothetical protein [Prevotellaceae bacterium]
MNLIFTLDYEIHGNGDGSPYNLMVEPTYRLMNLLEKYGFRLTILADVAEIFCFKKYFEETGEDKFFVKEIEKQLQDAVERGHDVQLHIHSSYFKSKYNGKSWEQCWDEYSMAALPYKRINEMVAASKQYLESLLRPVNSGYKCHAFRAANWSMMPTENIYNALIDNGIDTDTSVYKGGRQGGNVDYDYTNAYSAIFPYKASGKNINNYDPDGKITEYPIYTEMRYFWSFISFVRIFRMIRAKFHKHKQNENVMKNADRNDPKKLSLKSFFVKSPWKLDFNQATGGQLKNAVRRIKRKYKSEDSIPVVLIGHSKSFIPYNEKTLEKFLKWAKQHTDIEHGLFL